jgi:hypothetical protein
MSLIIKGMSLPSECSECLFSCYDVSVCAPAECIILGERSARHCRPKICPLVEIPTPHGRLIDADALENRVAEWRDCLKFRDAQILCTVIDMIHKAPTVIEAEVSE